MDDAICVIIEGLDMSVHNESVRTISALFGRDIEIAIIGRMCWSAVATKLKGDGDRIIGEGVRK